MGTPTAGRAAIWGSGDDMAFKLVVSDPKTRKSYQKEVGEEGLIGKKIGEKLSGPLAGLEGYELELTGGSDKDGFPMRKDVDGTARKKILISSPPGFHPGTPGVRKRKSVRGNTISEDIVQINTKVVKYGKKALDRVFASKKEEKPEEKGEEGKHEAEKKEAEPSEKPQEKPAEELKAEPADVKPEEKGEEGKQEKDAGGEEPAEAPGEAKEEPAPGEEKPKAE